MKLKIAIYFFLFSLTTALSQEKVLLSYKDALLSEVVVDLEKTFNIKLSFNSDLITNQTITFHKENALLSDILAAIEVQTNLEFHKISNRYYSVKAQEPLDFSQTQRLEEVLISEYLTSGVSKKQDGSIVLSPYRLGMLPGLTEPDVLQSLQLLPGIQSPSETASGLYVRGGTPDQNLILWDGIKMYHSGHFFGMISAFNPYITKDVKLYTSGTKARYGSRISSVIDISSVNEIPETTQGGFGFNMTHADAYLKTPIGNKAAVIVSARRSFTDVLKTFTFNNLSKRVFQNTKISEGNRVFDDDELITNKEVFNFWDLTLKTILKPSDRDELVISSLFTQNKLDYGFLLEDFDETSQDKLDIKNQGASISWNHVFNAKFVATVQAYYSKFDLEYLGSNQYADQFESTTLKKNSIDDSGLSFHTNWTINPSKTLHLGYQLSSNKVGYTLAYQESFSVNDDDRDSDLTTNNTHALYGEYQYKKDNKLLINIGLRTSYTSVLDQYDFEPRLQFRSALFSNLDLKLSAERLHQTLSQVVEFETEEFGLENQIWILADGEGIPQLESTQFSTGLAFKKNGWQFDVDLYFKTVDGLTSFTRGFNNVDNDNFSDGKSEIIGLDLLLKKKINNYRTWFSYSRIQNNFTFDFINQGKVFPGNFDITHQLTWSHTYKWNNFNLSLGWNFRTGTPYTKALNLIEIDDNQSINYDKINGERLPDYHRLDLSATYNFDLSPNNSWKGKLGFSLLNVYNQKSILNRTYKIRPDFDEAGNTFTLQEINKSSLGITPNLVFRLEF